MRSKTKNLLTDEQITRLVKANFGESTTVGSISELKGGMCNSAYVIDLIGENGKIVLKVSMSPNAPLLWHEGDNMAAETEAYRLIAQHTSVPVPKIYSYDFSKKLINCRYFFMEYLSGDPMSKVRKRIKPENMAAIQRQLGDYLAQIHHIQGRYFGYITTDDSRQFTTWKDAYQNWIRMILLDAKKRGYHLPYEKIENTLSDKYHYLDIVQEPRLIINDLWAGNVFVIKNGEDYEIQALTDFERATWGDPYAEFTYNALILDEVWREPIFWESYARSAGTNAEISRDDIIRMYIYKIYLFLIMVAETYRYPWFIGWMQRIFSRSFLLKYLKALESS